MALTGNLLLSVVAARVVSASANYLLNRYLTFRTGNNTSLVRYAGLAVGILALNYALMSLLTPTLPLVVAKVVTEVILFAVSFAIQRRYVFSPSQAVTVPTPVQVGR